MEVNSEKAESERPLGDPTRPKDGEASFRLTPPSSPGDVIGASPLVDFVLFIRPEILYLTSVGSGSFDRTMSLCLRCCYSLSVTGADVKVMVVNALLSMAGINHILLINRLSFFNAFSFATASSNCMSSPFACVSLSSRFLMFTALASFS